MNDRAREINEALNKACIAMQNYYKDALALSPGASVAEIRESRELALSAIKEFADTKREFHEMKLTPYEEKCLGTFDAANTIVEYKLCHECHDHKGGHHHEC
jgi:hypothetical protein